MNKITRLFFAGTLNISEILYSNHLSILLLFQSLIHTEDLNHHSRWIWSYKIANTCYVWYFCQTVYSFPSLDEFDTAVRNMLSIYQGLKMPLIQVFTNLPSLNFPFLKFDEAPKKDECQCSSCPFLLITMSWIASNKPYTTYIPNILTNSTKFLSKVFLNCTSLFPVIEITYLLCSLSTYFFSKKIFNALWIVLKSIFLLCSYKYCSNSRLEIGLSNSSIAIRKFRRKNSANPIPSGTSCLHKETFERFEYFEHLGCLKCFNSRYISIFLMSSHYEQW